MQEFKFKKSTVSLLDEGIMHIHLLAGSEIELSDAVLIVEAMGILGGGKKYPVLIDAGEFTSIDKEVRIFSASEESNIYTIADAIAYYSMAQKLVAEFYVRHNHPVVPTKVFSDKTKAIDWLKTFTTSNSQKS
jgi:hypothetical protein